MSIQEIKSIQVIVQPKGQQQNPHQPPIQLLAHSQSHSPIQHQQHQASIANVNVDTSPIQHQASIANVNADTSPIQHQLQIANGVTLGRQGYQRWVNDRQGFLAQFQNLATDTKDATILFLQTYAITLDCSFMKLEVISLATYLKKFQISICDILCKGKIICMTFILLLVTILLFVYGSSQSKTTTKSTQIETRAKTNQTESSNCTETKTQQTGNTVGNLSKIFGIIYIIAQLLYIGYDIYLVLKIIISFIYLKVVQIVRWICS